MNALGNIDGDSEHRGWKTIHGNHVWFDKDVAGGGGGSPSNSEKGVDKSEESGIIANRQKIIAEFQATNFNGDIHIPPKKIDVDALSFDSSHINGERNHSVSEAQAKQFIQEAKMSFGKSVNGVTFENYIGYNGCAYVDLNNNQIRTAFNSGEYNNIYQELSVQ